MSVHFRAFVSLFIFHFLHSLLCLEVQITDVYVLDNFPSLRTLIKEPQVSALRILSYGQLPSVTLNSLF